MKVIWNWDDKQFIFSMKYSKFGAVVNYFFIDMSSINPPQRKKRQAFSQSEDQKLQQLVEKFGQNDWGLIARKMGDRTPRQCRDRWKEYLSPTLLSTAWTPEEDELLRKKYEQYGAKWSLISNMIRGRSETSVKNRWRLLERRAIQNIQYELPIITPVIPSLPINFSNKTDPITCSDLEQFFNSHRRPGIHTNITSLAFDLPLFPAMSIA